MAQVSPAMVVVLMGVSGVGKTTVGVALARELGWPFVEADDFHPPANVAKMARNEPLTDADRDVWIDALRLELARHVARGESVVVACSALRRRHRDVLRGVADDVVMVHLDADPRVIEQRLRDRSGHFAGPGLLPSQLEDLERPADAVVVDASRPVDELVATIRERLGV